MHPPRLRQLLGCLFLLLLVGIAPAQPLHFNILKGGDVIGAIVAERNVHGEGTFYSMVSHSEFNLLWSNTVQSTTATAYVKGILHSCGAFMRVNKTMRDSSNMVRIGDQAHCYIHPDKRFIHTGAVEWTTARMYYEEPIGQTRIFVESEMAFRRFEAIGANIYRLHLSDGKLNEYTYRRGELQEVKVIRTFFDLYFKRV